MAGGAILAAIALAWLLLGGADRAMSPASAAAQLPSERGDWLHYGNDIGGTRFSPVAQITPDNVSRLKEAWRMQTGAGPDQRRREARPRLPADVQRDPRWLSPAQDERNGIQTYFIPL